MLTWGSLTGAAREAISIARADGLAVKLIAPRLLTPTRPQGWPPLWRASSALLVVEQTHSAQFHRYLKAHYDLPCDTRVLHAPGPLPISPGDILRELTARRAA